ncbi:putative nucleic acid-binding protein [Nocardiopsis aegyptia]|uniref:Putative nucleic acid-binding protein n=1 Tax=Nocardiopsis aegyptia TaxID=220378 RepID=A0A7Z0ETI8_9ACTN|nr:putative nucleic acid-binding protein [Nocardiopsis aegyptia]
MADTLIDSRVLIDVIKEDAAWAEWSAIVLAEAADTGRVVISQLVYAEVSLCLADPGQLDAALDDLVDREDLPWKAAELAAAAHAEYGRRGGSKRKQDVAHAGLLYRRPRGCAWISTLDTEQEGLHELLPRSGHHRPPEMRRTRSPTAPDRPRPASHPVTTPRRSRSPCRDLARVGRLR